MTNSIWQLFCMTNSIWQLFCFENIECVHTTGQDALEILEIPRLKHYTEPKVKDIINEIKKGVKVCTNYANAFMYFINI